MLTDLTLTDFKNFQQAHLKMGPLTVLIGTNAAGKSNLRDAFRFLHGISRGYNLAEILGEKYEAGVPVWQGIRGGSRETAYFGKKRFKIAIKSDEARVRYGIEVEIDPVKFQPRVVSEYMQPYKEENELYTTDSIADPVAQGRPSEIFARQHRIGKGCGARLKFSSSQPILTQIAEDKDASDACKKWSAILIKSLSRMRFLDLEPNAMRQPSIPGNATLGHRGENLSSVLEIMWSQPDKQSALIGWIRALTPMDIKELDFEPDSQGKTQMFLVEHNGRRISAYSASDGTLRFLAMVAALMGPQAGGFYFFEELDNGIHPSRLSVLLDLIQTQAHKNRVQIVATTHSPQLLGMLDDKSRQDASLIYRLEDRPDSQIHNIWEIPQAKEILETKDLARLHTSGWFENMISSMPEQEVGAA